MNWRGNLKSSGEKVQKSFSFDLEEQCSEITPLLGQIGNRDAVVDACLPPQLADDLRRNNVNAIWVPAILGDGASDGEIERQLLARHWSEQWWGGGQDKEKVLLTRDVEFYKRIRNKAILVSYHISNASARKIPSEASIRKELKKIIEERTKLKA